MAISPCGMQGAVNRVAFRLSTQKECISASADGTCIVWDLNMYRRRANIQANACKDAAYCTDESQIVTAGLLFFCRLVSVLNMAVWAAGCA